MGQAYAAFAIVSTIFSLATTAYSSQQTRRMYRNSARYSETMWELEGENLAHQAEMATINAEALGHEARMHEYIGGANKHLGLTEAVRQENRASRAAQLLRREGDRLMETQIGAYTKSGVLLSGSPGEVIRESNRNIKEDIEVILAEGDAEAFNAEFAAAISDIQGNMQAARTGIQQAGAMSTARGLRTQADLAPYMGAYESAMGMAQANLAQWQGYSSMLSSASQAGWMGYQAYG